MQLGTALNLPNPRINFGGTGKVPGKGSTAIFSFETGVLDSRINFSRTTNATVTNSAGQITYAPHNLIVNSESYDSSNWLKAGTTISANSVIAPNGTTTADKIVEDTSTGLHTVRQNVTIVSGTTYTYSFYVKIAERSNILVFDVNDSNFCYINLNTKSVTNGALVPTITDVGNGWLRIATTSTATGTLARNWVYLVQSGITGSYTGDGTSGIYIWGAQLEIGSTATTYNPTTVKNLLGYSELFDNAAWTKSNSFVQTNLLTYSEDFTVAGWAKTTVTATANSFIAPNGYQTADTLLSTGANSTALQTFTASAVPYTFSVYLYRKTGTGNIDITVDGTTWVTKTITAGWTRVDTTLTPAAGSKTAGIRIATNGDEVYAWGAQLVQGPVAGDYRRTDAAALPIYYPNHNGVVCAEKLVENTGNSTHAISEAYIAAIGTVVTFSCYMKAIDRNWARLTVNTVTGANASAYFNLSTGNVGSIAGGTASIVSAGNGWYRCSITGTLTTTNPTLAIFLANGDTGQVYTGDGTSGIYIFGAQLSDSASLDPYVLNAAAAPTAAAYYGARFDYDPVTLAPKGLLIEEQRANLLLNSSLAGTNLATQSVTVTAVPHTISFYGTGTVTLTGTAIATVVGTGAYPTRTTLTFTPTAGIILFTVTGTVQYAQLEIGSFATSFIPTAASQVTRAADVASIQGSNFYSWYNQNEGSIVYTGDRVVGASSRQISISDGTNTNFISLYSSGTDALQYLTMTTNSSTQADLSRSPVSSVVVFKQAASFAHNNVNFVLNNGTVASDITAVMPIVDRMNIGLAPNNVTAQQNQHIKQISYYPQRLSFDVLKGLTA